jgi:GNAT superfamily N-acetyltransferase
MLTEISVRPVQPADFTEWKSLWEEFNSHLDRSIDLEVTDRTWQRFFEPASRMHAVVAELSGRLLGFGHFVFYVRSEQFGESCFLQDLFTREADRMQGIGRALVEQIVMIAGGFGATNVYFEAAAGKQLGNELFERIATPRNLSTYRIRVPAARSERMGISLEQKPLAVNAANAGGVHV